MTAPDSPGIVTTDARPCPLAKMVARVVASAPPLRPEQRDRLAILLRPTGRPT